MAQQIIVTKDNYGIGLSCNFIDKNKNPIDLTDKVVEVVIVDANNETIDIKQAVIVDYTNAKASIVLEKIHTSTLGLHKTFWSVLDENQNITAQEDVYYYVKDKNNGSEGIVGSDVSIEETVEDSKFKELIFSPNKYLISFSIKLDLYNSFVTKSFTI